jgi:hypothetical protein
MSLLTLPSDARAEGFSGAISLPLLPDLIQIYTVALATGALTIRRGEDHGTIWFDRGEMVHAVCGAEVGEAAVYRLLQWNDGKFSLDRDATPPVRSITASWQKVLMEGCRLLDESGGNTMGAAFAELEGTLAGLRGVAVFDAEGRVIAQRSRLPESDLATAGPALVEMLRKQARVLEALSVAPSSFLDCCWILGDQMHLIEALPGERLLHVVVERNDGNLAVIRRAVGRVVPLLS